MNRKVGLEQVKAYALEKGVDIKTAAKSLGLSKKDAEALAKIGGDMGAPVDGFSKKPDKTHTFSDGRRVEAFLDKKTGKYTFKYYAADGKALNEAYFMKATGNEGKHFVVDSKGRLATVKNEAKQTKQRNGVKAIAATVAAGAAAGAAIGSTGAGIGAVPGALIGAVGGLLLSCTTSCEPPEPADPFNRMIYRSLESEKEKKDEPEIEIKSNVNVSVN